MARFHHEKSKLIQTLEETPLINYACKKVGIGRTTFYRWMKDNLQFKKDVERALQSGRSQWNEVAESLLMKNVKSGKMDAIKFFLTHNDNRYIPKRSVFAEPLTVKERREYERLFSQSKPIPREVVQKILKALKNYGIIQNEKNSAQKN